MAPPAPMAMPPDYHHSYIEEHPGIYAHQQHDPSVGIERNQTIDDEDRALFRVASAAEFKPGAIFKTPWSEPLEISTAKSEITAHRSNPEDTSACQGIRRFIVVANDEDHCTGVPILTYKRRGCSKPGVTPAQHGIIHQSNKVPRLLDGEPVLGFLPVRATLDMGYEYLAKESRVNYARLEFVEHHVPVCFVGRVSPKDFEKIVAPAVEYFCDRRRRGIDDS